MRSWSASSLVILVACNGPGGDTSVDPSEIDGAVDGAPAAYTDLWGIDGTDPECEAVDLDGCTEPVVMEGNTRFYAGELVWDDAGNVSGYESKILFVNAAWKDTVPEVADCLVVWNLSGTMTEGSGAYRYEFTLAATLNDSESTCIPEYLMAEPQTDAPAYYVNLTEDGAATVFFAPSGNLYANGFGEADGAEGAIAFVSDGNCEWIGDGTCEQ